MKEDVNKYVAESLVCQKNKIESVSPAGLLQPLPIPERVWAEISMDYIKGLSKPKGFNSMLVVVDCLSKYAHFLSS